MQCSEIMENNKSIKCERRRCQVICQVVKKNWIRLKSLRTGELIKNMLLHQDRQLLASKLIKNHFHTLSEFCQKIKSKQNKNRPLGYNHALFINAKFILYSFLITPFIKSIGNFQTSCGNETNYTVTTKDNKSIKCEGRNMYCNLCWLSVEGCYSMRFPTETQQLLRRPSND